MKLFIAGILALGAVIMAGSNLTATDDGRRVNQSPELGQVKWNRDLDDVRRFECRPSTPWV